MIQWTLTLIFKHMSPKCHFCANQWGSHHSHPGFWIWALGTQITFSYHLVDIGRDILIFTYCDRNSLWHMYHDQRQPKHNCGTVVYRLSLLYNFIYQNLDSGSAEVQLLLEACQRFAMVRIFDNGLTGNKDKYLSLANHTTKTINHHRQSLDE